MINQFIFNEALVAIPTNTSIADFRDYSEDGVGTVESQLKKQFSWSWSGSPVPMYERHIQFLESLLPLFKGLPLLPHQRYIKDVIRGYKHDIERALRREFIEADR